MEQFLLQVEGHIVGVAIEDSRGADGTIPVLVDSDSKSAGVLPMVVPDAPKPAPRTRFPHMPRGLADRIEADADLEEKVKELQLDVSALPAGLFLFRLDQFAKHALAVTQSGVSKVELAKEQTPAWGSVKVAEPGA